MNPFATPTGVPEAEIEFAFSRSSGPGGQNVNKTSTKAELRWNLDRSTAFTEEEKALLRTGLASRLTKRGELIVSSSRERSQLQNRAAAMARLQQLVADALLPTEARIPTMPTAASRRKRLERKVRVSRKKQERKETFEE